MTVSIKDTQYYKSAIMLSAVMLSAVMLSAVMLSAVKLAAVEGYFRPIFIAIQNVAS
jgi:hypothetical protein